MTAEPSIREQVLQGIFEVFVEGDQVTVTTVAARSGVSRQRVHAAGLRVLITRFATLQRESTTGGSRLAASQISALRTELEFFRQAAAPEPVSSVSNENDEPVAQLREQIQILGRQIALLQDEIIAERRAVALVLGGTD